MSIALSLFSSGIEKLRVFPCALEDVSEYCGFSDFLDTFVFRKMTKENIETPELRIPRGELKARIFIRKGHKVPNGILFFYYCWFTRLISTCTFCIVF